MEIVLHKHDGECSPIEPCAYCKTITYLRAKLGDTEMRKAIQTVGRAQPLEKMGLRSGLVLELKAHGMTYAGDLVEHTHCEIVATGNNSGFGLGTQAGIDVAKALSELGLTLHPERNP